MHTTARTGGGSLSIGIEGGKVWDLGIRLACDNQSSRFVATFYVIYTSKHSSSCLMSTRPLSNGFSRLGNIILCV